MVAILYPRRLRNLLDVTQPQGTGLPDQGVPLLFSSNSSFVIETVAGGGAGFSLGASNLGNTLGQTGVTGSRVVLAGIGNLTLSQLTDANGGTISISGGTAGAGFSAGVSGGNTAGDTGVTGTRLVLAGGNSITLSQATDANGGTVTISGPTTSQSVQTQSRFNLTLDGNTAGALALVSSGVLTLAGGNSITLSQNGNAITISGATTSQSVQTQNMVAVTLSGNTSGAQALISSGTMTLAGGNNITVSQNGNAVTISGPNVGGAQTGISGLANSETTYTSGSVTFSALGAITIRSTTGQHFQFSVNSQTVQTQSLFSAGVSTGGNTAGDTGVTGTRMVFVGSNNITLSQATAAAGGTITISGPTTVAQTNQSGGVYAVGNTYSSSSGTYDARSLSIRGDGIISVAATNSGWRISASQSVQAETQTFVGGLAASNTTYTSGTVTITGVGGGVTVSSNTGQRIDISVAAQTVQTQGILSAGVSTGGNTAGNTQVSTGSRLVIVGSGMITASQGTAAGASTITLNATQTGTQFSAGLSNIGNTAGDTGTVAGRLVLAGGNNITLSGSTNGVSETITISAGAGGGFSAGISGGNTSGDTGATGTRVVFAGGNNITLSGSTNANGGTVTISAPNLGAGAMSAGASNLGNTAGATGITGTQLVLVGTNAITLSQTTGANGGTLSIDAPATSSLIGVSGVSISTNGATISVMATSGAAGYLESWFPHSVAPHTFGQQGQGTLHVQPMPVPTDIRMDRILLPTVVSNATNSSNSISISQYVGIYTRNASTLSLLTSQSSATNFSGSGTVGSYSLYGGRRWQSMGLTTTLSSGDYWIGIIMRSTTGGGAGHSISQVLMTQHSNATFSGWSGLLGGATNASMQYQKGLGTFTATTAGLPSAIPFASLTGTGTLVMMPPVYALVSGTV